MDRLQELQARDPASLSLQEKMELQALVQKQPATGNSGMQSASVPDASLANQVSQPQPTPPTQTDHQPFYPTPTGKAPPALPSKAAGLIRDPDSIDTGLSDMEPDNTQPESLSTRLSHGAQAGGSVAAGSKFSTKGGAFADPKESVAKLTSLADDLQDKLIKAGDRGEDLQELRAVIAQASEDKKSATTRAEWADVAQTLAKAVFQSAAAMNGGTQANMSNLPIGTIDYGRRIEQAGKDYSDTVGSAKDVAALKGQERKDLAGALEQGYKAHTLPHEEELRASREAQRSSAQMDRYASVEKSKDSAADRKEGQFEKREQIRSTQKALDAATKEQQAAITLFSDKSAIEDLSKKSGEKLTSSLGRVAGAAGISADELQKDLEKTDKPGKLWGTNPDPVARQQVIQSKLNEKKDQVAHYKNLLDSLTGLKKNNSAGGTSSPAVPSGGPSTSPAGGNTSSGNRLTPDVIKAYASKYKMDENAARMYLKSHGYTE